MMFGTEEVFEYMECGYCGCLQIKEVPPNIGSYYPESDYYSYAPPRTKTYSSLIKKARILRTQHLIGKSNILGAIFSGLSRRKKDYFDWFRRAGMSLDSRVIDIGCGAGKLLNQLHHEGFTNLHGADPFIPREINYPNGITIRKAGVADLKETFDFVMLNHSFEHMPDPVGNLRNLRKLVASNGRLLLRIPVADCYARRKYGVHWVAWDPPRHLYLYTVRSMRILAELTGFELVDVVYDSGRFQFASEERIRRPFAPTRTASEEQAGMSFTPEERRAMKAFARQLNLLRDGDTAGFYLRPR
jgi:2-polyprenyl-3-methyl-5-hydroxy-6-metoxy-1,4-benzoquinol methylase